MMYRQYGFNKTKYNNVRQTYGGYSYMSKLEARQAAELDLRKEAGDILDWDRQFKVELRVNDRLICNYYCDFRVHNTDGTYTLLETKGIETEVYRLKRKLLEAVWLPEHLDYDYLVVK